MKLTLRELKNICRQQAQNVISEQEQGIDPRMAKYQQTLKWLKKDIGAAMYALDSQDYQTVNEKLSEAYNLLRNTI